MVIVDFTHLNKAHIRLWPLISYTAKLKTYQNNEAIEKSGNFKQTANITQ